jgi:S-DNA-T family DNA segregation ATPase FtsK/SpoIIIE
MVVVDDLTEMCDTEFDLALSELARLGRERPVTIVAAVDNLVARRQYSGVVPDLRKDQIGLLLQPDIDSDGDLLGVSLPRRSTRVWPEGRGYYAERGAVELWQVALPDPW